MAADLYEGAQPRQVPRRSTIPAYYAADSADMISRHGWECMLSAGRFLFANVGPVRGAILDIGTYATLDGWMPRFIGRDTGWGDTATEWLTQWFRICDVRGAPFDFLTDLYLGSVALDRDGDFAVLLAVTEDGYPMIQPIPAHRIGSRDDTLGRRTQLKEGPYKGLDILNGVIFDAFSRPVALNILGQTKEQDRQVSLRDVALFFMPDWYDQGRGIPTVSHAIPDWSDVRDIRDHHKLAIRMSSAVGLIEDNERGAADDDGAAHLSRNTTTGITTETLEAGAIRYFRANSGAGLKTLEAKRPSTEERAFVVDDIMRGAFAGMGWPIEFLWDAAKLGGTANRMIIARANRAILKRQRAIGRMFARVAPYAIAKAIKLGLLPGNDEWHAWDAQLPRRITADAGNDAKIRLAEYTAGLDTLSNLYGERGESWKQAIKQRVAERKYLLEQVAGTGILAEEIIPPAQTTAQLVAAAADTQSEDEQTQNPGADDK